MKKIYKFRSDAPSHIAIIVNNWQVFWLLMIKVSLLTSKLAMAMNGL